MLEDDRAMYRVGSVKRSLEEIHQLSREMMTFVLQLSKSWVGVIIKNDLFQC